MNPKHLVALLLLVGTGCSSMNNTEKDAIAGGAIGTGLGAIAGRGHPGAMIVGGLLGTGVGALVGNSEDREQNREKRFAQAQAVAAAEQARNQMSLNDVIQMAQRNTPDGIIINQINTTRSYFNLTTNDIIDLQNQGVSQGVISYMQSRRPTAVIVQPAPAVIYGPPPPPPPFAVGVGVGFPR
ncbi:MAG TPA: hypothetical protein VFE62_28085 [Gemmataceae bacterium]|nr:hypothetical protein [Gemmataceae bacterium]